VDPRSNSALRVAIATIAAGACVAALWSGAVTWLDRANPSLAARIAPENARIVLTAAQADVAAGQSPSDPGVRRLVGAALARDATLPGAIELRALDAQGAHDDARAARLFELSSAISRRSLPTRLWLIQRAVDRGDVEGALGDFDIALRTSSAAPDILFPVLARAATDPTLAAPIARRLDRPEDWRIAFLHYAITEARAAMGVSDIMLRMRDRPAIAAAGIDQTLVGELVVEQNFALARRVYDAFHPASASSALVRDPDFSHPELTFPFGWTLTEKGDAGAERNLVEGASSLAYQAPRVGDAQVATQLLLLGPGAYRVSTRTAAAGDEGSAAPYWTLTCAQPGGAQIALLDQPPAAGATASADFDVVPGCPAQWLVLSVRSSDAPSRAGAIAWVDIARR